MFSAVRFGSADSVDRCTLVMALKERSSAISAVILLNAFECMSVRWLLLMLRYDSMLSWPNKSSGADNSALFDRSRRLRLLKAMHSVDGRVVRLVDDILRLDSEERPSSAADEMNVNSGKFTSSRE